jgi:hypothetical protein
MRSPARNGPSPQPSPSFAGRGGQNARSLAPIRLMHLGAPVTAHGHRRGSMLATLDDVQAALSYAAWRAEEVEIPLT